MSGTKITRYLPNNEYQAAISAAAPTALNPFATIADVAAVSVTLQAAIDGGSTYSGAANVDITTTGAVDFFSTSGADVSGLNLAGGAATILGFSLDGVGNETILMDGAGIQLFSSISDRGAGYGADYSVNGISHFGNQWVTDKGYDDSHLGGKDVTALVTGPLVGQDGFAVTWDQGAGKYTLAAASGGNTLYSANDTIGAGRIATLTDTLTFTGGQVNVIGNIAISGNVVTPAKKLDVTGNTTSTSYASFIGNVGAGAATTTGLNVAVTPLAGTATHRGIFASSVTTGVAEAIGIYGQSRNGTNQSTAIYGQIVSNSVGGAFGTIAIRGRNQGGTAGNLHYAGKFENTSTGTTSYGVHSDNTGAATTSIAGYFSATNATNNYAIIVPSTGGNVVIGAVTGTSKLNVNGDIEILGSTNGSVHEDRLGGGNKCRIYVQEDSPGVFTIYTELVP